MGFHSVLTMAQRWVTERASAGSVAIDATAGGGVDTLFLARLLGPKGRVYAFDVQAEALERTGRRLEGAAADGVSLAQVSLIQAGHEQMSEMIQPQEHGTVSAVMFNLGYLPNSGDNGNSPVITQPDTTLTALDSAVQLIARGGIVTVVVYPGHAGGREEAEAVEAWVRALPAGTLQSVCYRFPQKEASPYLLAIVKR